MITTRQKLVQRIAEKLLQDDVLDIKNFEDTPQLLECVQNAIFDELRNFTLISGPSDRIRKGAVKNGKETTRGVSS